MYNIKHTCTCTHTLISWPNLTHTHTHTYTHTYGFTWVVCVSEPLHEPIDGSQDGAQSSHLCLHSPRCNVNSVIEIPNFSNMYSYEPGSVKYFISRRLAITLWYEIYIIFMFCTCERVQTVTKSTKESWILQWPAIVMVPELTCQARSVLPLHTASKQWLMGSYEHDRQIVLFPGSCPAFCCWYIISCEWCGGIESVKLCVGKLGLRILAGRVKVPLVSSYSGGQMLVEQHAFSLSIMSCTTARPCFLYHKQQKARQR